MQALILPVPFCFLVASLGSEKSSTCGEPSSQLSTTQSCSASCQPGSVSPWYPAHRCSPVWFVPLQEVPGQSGCRAASWFCRSANMNFLCIYLNEDGLSLLFSNAREKKIHKLFFSLPKCFTGRFWAKLIWLIPMGLSSDNYATRTAPTWGISCHSGVHIGKALFVLYLCSSLQICVSEHHEPPSCCPSVSCPSLPPFLVSA